MDSIIKTVLDGKWSELKKHIEEKSVNMITQKVNDKKVDILAAINKVDRTQMEEILAVTGNEDN